MRSIRASSLRKSGIDFIVALSEGVTAPKHTGRANRVILTFQPMARNISKWICLLTALGGLIATGQVKPKKDPRLVLLISVDQFRYDYLTRYRAEYKGGLDRLLRTGANFVNANLDHYPTVTAVGHSTMLSGATPQTSGIVGNEWYDREAGKTVTSVSDDSVRLVGRAGRCGGVAAPPVGEHPRRRDEARHAGSSQGDRYIAERSCVHSARGPHGRCGLLV